MSVFAVSVLVVAGIAVVATATYYELRPTVTPGQLHLVDDLGRSVTVPSDPTRVVVLGPSILDTMFRLGLRSHVVGVDCYAPEFGGLTSDYSPDQVALWNLSSPMCVQSSPFNVEQLLNLTPQLVLSTTLISVAAVETISQTDHIPVVLLQPPTLSGILLDVSTVAEIFGVTGAATAVNDQLRAELGNASTIDANLSASGTPFPTILVTYSTDASGYWTYGPTSFGQSLIELAGGASIAANATIPYPELSGEQVLASQPQYLVYGTGFGLNLTSYATAPFWPQLTAVEHGRAVGIDSNYLTEPDPTMILAGVPALLSLLHPGNG